ncbi:hypothetical protein B0H19DRAFT_1368079 [Mycena capillaripes]|nr:hypothetical protein B0H19DRAFT_1368079 [Mycena capillaripes]
MLRLKRFKLSRRKRGNLGQTSDRLYTPDFLAATRLQQTTRTSGSSKIRRLFRKFKSKITSFSTASRFSVRESTDPSALRHMAQISIEDLETLADNTVAPISTSVRAETPTDNTVDPISISTSVRAVLLEQTERTSGSSKTEIEQLIEEYELKIATFDRLITALDAENDAIAAFVELRDRDRAIVAVLRYLIAPIRILPVEMLAEIFLLTIREGGEDEGPPWYPYSSHIKRAFRVSHICTHWREVANSTPRLWTGPITVIIDYKSWDSSWYVDGMREWLARSAPLSIPVSIYLEGMPGLEPDPELPPILEELLKISPRWSSLRLCDPMPRSFFRRLAENELSSLEKADLINGFNRFNFDSATISFCTPPRLRKLKINLQWLIAMPWAQLTNLTLTHGRSPEIPLDILAQCTNLVSASISTLGWRLFPQLSRDIITLDRLQTLFLAFTRTTQRAHWMPFLDRLSAPALERLRLHSEPDSTWANTHLTAFQLRSQHITQLEISHSNPTSDDLRVSLSHAPFLTSLVVTFSPHCIDDTLLRALSYEDGVEPLVPRLHDLTLYEIDWVSEDILLGMILSRWWTDAQQASRSAPSAVSRWKRINLTVHSRTFRFSRHFLAVASDLESNGLRMKVYNT